MIVENRIIYNPKAAPVVRACTTTKNASRQLRRGRPTTGPGLLSEHDPGETGVLSDQQPQLLASWNPADQDAAKLSGAQ